MRTCTIALIALLLVLSGCSRLRFVIDAVPAVDELTETEVLRDDAGKAGSAKVALIDVTGLIIDAQTPGLLAPGENPLARFVESLNTARHDSAVKAVIIRINSPGGTVTASDVMYREVMHFRETTGKPVVMLMSDVAASGGYYLACAGDEIIAHPTTVTGSIGVIIQTINVADGLRKIGVKAEALTSGPNKAMGSPLEPMPDEHRELLMGLVREFYDGFRGVVTTSRPMIAESDLERVTDGRVLTGTQALKAGLIDRVGDLRDAFTVAKSRAGLQQARLMKYHRPLEHVGSAYAHAPSPAPHATSMTQVNLLQLNVMGGGGTLGGTPTFYYLWDPTAW